MAAFLRLRGHEAELLHTGTSEGGHPLGAWLFPRESEGLQDDIVAFEKDTANVSPRAYQQATRETRTEMFKFLGID